IAKKVASLVWDVTGYRFVYKRKQASTTSASDNVVTYSCFCAQNDKEITKTRLTDEENKRCARMKMDRLPCNRWLHATVDSVNPSTVRLRVLHHCAHCHYVNISLNDEITKMVEQMRDQPASNVCHDLLSSWTEAYTAQI
ncbi:hypothetical protein DFH09DRAFT_939195, partial [Mycena vulgaris]